MNKPLLIGHRGARAIFPEHSLAGYDYALKCGVDYVDVDVVVTKDRELLAYHDLYVNSDILASRYGNILSHLNGDDYFKKECMASAADDLMVKNLTVAQLKERYLLQLNPNSAYAKRFLNQAKISNLKLSTLAEIIQHCDKVTNNTIKYQIEVKNSFIVDGRYSYSPRQLAEIIYHFIILHNLIDRVKIQAFDWRILYYLAKLDARVVCAYLVAYDLPQNWLKYYAGSEINEVAKKVGDTDKIDQEFLIKVISALGGYSFEPEDNQLTKKDLEFAHNLGLKVIVWPWPEHSGFNYNEELVKKLINWGVDGIITDDPAAVSMLLTNI